MLTLLSPAKVNLFLKVGTRYPDGYHEIETLIHAIDLFDRITIAIQDRDEFASNDHSLKWDKHNLITQAIQLFRKKSTFHFHCKVVLEKNIPMQAGLGGGSSNAATILWGINHLLGSPFNTFELQEMGLTLGSDVPFFFSQGFALCKGKGEMILSPPLNHHIPKNFTLIIPEKGLSTKEVYHKFSPAASPPHESAQYRNDLETPAFSLYPELNIIKKTCLEQGASTVFMTGSGSALVAINLKQALNIPNIRQFTVKPLMRSPESWYKNN